ncbi:MAG: hypothetical protein QM811_27210 [Pirellulales bacterium]
MAEVVTETPPADLIAALPDELRTAVEFVPRADTRKTELIWKGGLLTTGQVEQLAAAFKKPEDRRAVRKIARRREGRDANPAAFGDPFPVPQLAIADATAKAGWTLFDLNDREIEWNLADCTADLNEATLNPAMSVAAGAVIDIAGDQLAIELLTNLREQMQLRNLRGPKSPERLEEWLDRELDIPESTQQERRVYIPRSGGFTRQTRYDDGAVAAVALAFDRRHRTENPFTPHTIRRACLSRNPF